MKVSRLRRGVAAGLFALLAASNASGADDSATPDTEIWRKVRADLFGDRPLHEESAGGRIELAMPARALDAAVVPLAIRVRASPDAARVRKLYLVIDRNPSPIAAIFEFGAASGGAEIETRVRIEAYTWVRVIAESADGSLAYAKHFIKAAGGCSAPAGKSLAARLTGIGQMRWRIDSPADAREPALVQLMIRHPNDSGMAMDPLTRLYDPPLYIRHVRVSRGDELVLSADVDFSISENPAFRFRARSLAGQALHARVTDTGGRVFEGFSPGEAAGTADSAR